MSVMTPDAEERALAAMKCFKILAQTRNAEMRVVGRGLLNLSESAASSSGLQPDCLGGGYWWRVDGVCSREGWKANFCNIFKDGPYSITFLTSSILKMYICFAAISDVIGDNGLS